jgi:hypothetical protein
MMMRMRKKKGRDDEESVREEEEEGMGMKGGIMDYWLFQSEMSGEANQNNQRLSSGLKNRSKYCYYILLLDSRPTYPSMSTFFSSSSVVIWYISRICFGFD